LWNANHGLLKIIISTVSFIHTNSKWSVTPKREIAFGVHGHVSSLQSAISFFAKVNKRKPQQIIFNLGQDLIN